MDFLRTLGFAAGFGCLIYGIAAGVHGIRARAMRALASRWGLAYRGKKLPASFRMHGYPANEIRRTWNVLEGQQGDEPLLIFDSQILAGRGTGVYCTFIAIHTDQNPFEDNSPQEKLMHSNGWTALYRIRLIQVPGTISIERIEEHLAKLGVSRVAG